MEDVAIIGMSCRFPGTASSIKGLWQMLVEGQSAWSEFPKDRLNINGFYHPDGHRQGSIPFRGAHFLQHNLASFDAAFFSMTEEELKALDPQQRMLLETSFEAIENAGLRTEDLKGSDTSVYIGAFVRDYEQISLRDMDFQPRYAATGSGTAIMSNRISYFYDLRGASMTVDTGCSGSMVAVHQACQNLLAGSSSIAFAGGAGLILTPNTMMPMAALNFLSPDGKSFTFDSRANGYGRGEGVGLVILKKLSHALRDNDPIRAVIRSSHLSQDGRTAGITLPNAEAQIFNIRRAYEQAGLNFEQTGYVECHGTGTRAGDAAELGALAQTLALDRALGNPLIVGSIKPNIGHLEGAAGIAGIIKAVLVLEKATIPPNINFNQGTPDINFAEWKLQVPTQPRPWPIPGIRRASVNCFGFGGTNAHAVLDEGEYYVRRHQQDLLGESDDGPSSELDDSQRFPLHRQLVLLSAPNQSSIQRITQALADHILNLPTGLSQKSLDDMAYTLGCRRSQFTWKGFVIADDFAGLVKAISAVEPKKFLRSDPNPHFKVAFLFCGQGAQRAQMGQGLMQYASFRRSLQLASAHMEDTLNSPYNLLEEMMKPPEDSRIDRPDISQPATTTLQVALIDLMASIGVRPVAVVGHSSGEIAAAYACGLISRETAWAVAYHRGACARSLQDCSSSRGTMCSVGLSEASADILLGEYQGKLDIVIACINSPKSVTLSGSSEDITTIMRDLKTRGVFCRELRTGLAYHSKCMESIEEKYLNAMVDLPHTPQPSENHMYSTLTGNRLLEHKLGPQYWADNLKSPVLFAGALTEMLQEVRPDMVVELSPRGMLHSCFTDTASTVPSLGSVPYSSVFLKDADEQTTLLTTLGDMWALGCNIDMLQVVARLVTFFKRHHGVEADLADRNGHGRGLTTLADLPLYPWDHSKTFWHESPVTKDYRQRTNGRKDLIGAPCPDSVSQEPRWRGFLRVAENPWLKDHKVQQTIIYPAAGMVSTAIEGARQHVPEDADIFDFEVREMQIEKPMVIAENEYGLETMVHMKRTSPDTSTTGVSFKWAIYGRVLDGTWTRHARGTVHAVQVGKVTAMAAGFDSATMAIPSGANSVINTQLFYESLDLMGMNYGPAFRNIEALMKGEGASVGTIRIADTKAMMPHGYEFDHIVHPTTLDSAFQLLFAIDDRPMVPTFVNSIFISAKTPPAAGERLTGCAKAVSRGLRGAEASVVLTTGSWSDVTIAIKGLRLTSLSSADYLPSHRNLCTEIKWKEDYTTSKTSDLEKLLELMAHKYPQLSILQVGGNFAPAHRILEHLASLDGRVPRVARYTFTNVTTLTIQAGRLQYGSSVLDHVIEQRDLQTTPESGLKYHLVLEFVPFNGPDGLGQYLHPDGIVLRGEAERLSTDYESDSACSVNEARHEVFLRYFNGTSEVSLAMVATPAFEALREDYRQPKVVVVLPKVVTEGLLQLKNNLLTQLATMFVQVSDCSIRDIMQQNISLQRSVVISLLDLSTTPYLWDCGPEEFEAFKRLRDAAKSILWVTRGANGTTKKPQSALIIGLSRTLASEDPGKVMTTLDLASDSCLSVCTTSKVILKALERSVLPSTKRQLRETEYVESGDRLLIPRLVPLHSLSDLVEDDLCRFPRKARLFLDSEPKELVLNPLGEKNKPLENFLFVPRTNPLPLGPTEVEIQFSAAALHHSDLQTAMGLSDEKTIGIDVQGTITRLGSDVTGLRLEDKVVAMVSGGGFKNKLRADRRFVNRIFGGLLMCIPSLWVTVFYSLTIRCQIGPRKRVLVHRGATATGQVAIQVAKLLGAEVYTTVCNDGKDLLSQKNALKNAFGFEDAEIEDSSKPGWDARLLNSVGGQKMDIILTPGQIPFDDNINIVKRTGTVVYINDGAVEHGVKGHHPAAHATLHVNFTDLFSEEPDLVAEIFERVGHFILGFRPRISMIQHPKPFLITHLSSALKTMKREPNLGTGLIFANKTNTVEMPVRPYLKGSDLCTDNGTYVLAGGLGGLGRAIALHLVDNGARYLMFLSRSSKVSIEADTFLELLKTRGVVARHCIVDVCDAAALREAIRTQISSMPAVCGVVQAAAVLMDNLFERMSYDDWRTAVLPKTWGTMNLVDVFDDPDRKPWFIFLSSSSGIIGNRGQANYAAGNVFMDALAGSGLIHGRAVSLDIGPVLEVGMVADNVEMMRKLRETGFYGIRRLDFLRIVERAIAGDIGPDKKMPSQVVLGVGTGGLILQNQPKDPYWARTALYSYLNCIDMPPPDLITEKREEPASTTKSLLSSVDSIDEAARIIGDALKQELASRLATIKAHDVDLDRSIPSYGVDSILAVRLRIWTQKEVGVNLSIFDVLTQEPMKKLCLSMARQVYVLGMDKEDEDERET